jgi:hypothetical protein
MKFIQHTAVLIIATLILISSAAKAQKVSNYWTFSTTPMSNLNTDPYLGLSVARTNVERKMMVQLNGGYCYQGVLFANISDRFENYSASGAVASIDIQKGLDKNYYVGATVGGKYISTKAYEWEITNGTGIQQKVPAFQKKMKGTFAFVLGTKSDVNKVGFCYDLSCGFGMAAKSYTLNNEQRDNDYFSDAEIAPGGIFPHGHLTLRVGYRVGKKDD